MRSDFETLFSKHLIRLGLHSLYEQPHGVKNPDFTIKAGNKVVAVAELKQQSYSKAQLSQLKLGKPVSLSRDPYYFVRKAINEAGKQFRYSKEYPCILIVDPIGSVLPVILLAAMLGDLVVTWPVPAQEKSNSEVQYALGDNGRMRHSKINKPYNTTITAIGTMTTIRPGELESGYPEIMKLYRTKDAIDYFAAAQKTREELKKAGFDFHEEAVSISYVVNPYANLPFPSELIGKYDQVFRYDPSASVFDKIYDGIEATQKATRPL